ncbi:MAG: hypothetical protein JWO22_156 [Frankiales bacterium]|nr:hypothetical protein [Frankiales bacterium]
MRKEFRGYDPIAVDAFLARCLATPGIYRSRFPELRGRTPGGARVTPEQIRGVRFGKATLGYQIRVVDDLLDELEAELRITTAPEPVPAVEAVRALRTISLVEAERASLARTAGRR